MEEHGMDTEVESDDSDIQDRANPFFSTIRVLSKNSGGPTTETLLA